MKRLSGVRSSLRLFNIAVDGNLVLHEIQRSVDLANTCYRDLQRLIALRNEHLRLLESHDVGLLRRVDEAIARARRSVTDACRIVERFRPGVQHGNSTRTPLHMRIEWLTSNSSEFHKLEPVIRQHHAEVLAELDSLRAVASRPLPSESRKHIEATRHIAGPAEKEVFDNLALLGDIIGDGFAVTSSPPPSLPTTPSPPMPNAVPRKPIEYSCLPEPVFPNALPEPLPSPGCVSFGPRPSSPAWSLAGSGARDRATPSQEDDTGLSLLFGVEPDRKAEPPRLRRHQSPSFIIQCLPSAPSDMLSQIPGGDRAVSETSSVHPLS